MSKLATRDNLKHKVYKKHINDQENDIKDEKVFEMKDENMQDQFSNYQELNSEQKKIANWLEKLKFRKKVVGGINEYDVWKKIVELNAMYEDALKTERLRCSITIDQYKNISVFREDGQEREELI